MKRSILILFFLNTIFFTCFSQTDSMVTNVLTFNWTPDGKSLVFTVIRGDKARKLPSVLSIFKLDISSGVTTLLVKNARNPNVSPQGDKMAYAKINGQGLGANNDIYIYDFKKNESIPVIIDSFRKSSPSWSPDGNKLVYSVARTIKGPDQSPIETSDICIIEIKTGKVKVIAEGGPFMTQAPAWAPKGDKIAYYLEKGDNHDQIYLTNELGEFHTNLTADTSTHNYYPSWFGDKILFTQAPGMPTVMDAKGAKSKINGLQAFWSIYNESADKIAFLTPGSRANPSELKLFNLKTKEIVQVLSKEKLNGLVF